MHCDQMPANERSDLISCDPEGLVDLQDVYIDTSLPLQERMTSYLDQVGNPYLFRVDGLVIKATYLPGASRRLSDALPGLLAQ